MVTNLGTVTLRNGENMGIELIEPPDLVCDSGLAQFYAHKAGRWLEDVTRRLQGKVKETSLDYYYLGKVDGEYAGGIWVSVPRDTRDVGILGHVYTPEKHRRKGVCDFLMRAAMKKFKQEGGRAMYLAAGEPMVQRIYIKHGFKGINPPPPLTPEIFQWIASGNPGFEKRYFTKVRPVHVRPITWGDMPRFEALYNVPNHPWMVRDETLGIYRDTGYEAQFLTMMEATQNGMGVCMVLENSNKRVTGVARLTKSPRPWCSHVATLEFFIHPVYFSDGPDLLRETLEKAASMGAGEIRAWAASSDKKRASILRRAGFKKRGLLRKQFHRGETRADLLAFSLEK